jgi:prepilin-type N-terminal cleavage/methylation domain-containing protein
MLASRSSLIPQPHSGARRAFTLLEIMIVVGIMGVIVTMGVPIVVKAWKKAPMGKALSELVEVCSHARAQAIMQGKQVDLMFYPQEGRFSIGGSAAASAPGAPAVVQVSIPGGSSPGSGSAGQFPREITIEMLDINKLPHDFRLDESAKVRFFPNGTCDELTVILLSDRGERREVMLEVTTALAMVESDPRRFR